MIAGGKLTTYRVMAQGRRRRRRPLLRTVAGDPPRESITDRVPLVGADGFEARSNQRVLLLAPGRAARGPDRPPAREVRRPGRRAARRCWPAGPSWREPLEGAEDYLAAEVVYAVTHEGARHLDDVLTRRTRISIETFDRGIHAARPAARLMAGELGWDEARTDDEVDHYLRRVEAERQSQTQAHRPGGRRGAGQRPRHRLMCAAGLRFTPVTAPTGRVARAKTVRKGRCRWSREVAARPPRPPTWLDRCVLVSSTTMGSRRDGGHLRSEYERRKP